MISSASRLAERYRWLPFVVPFVVYSLAGVVEPKPAATTGLTESVADGVPDSPQDSAKSAGSYPLYYGLRIGLTVLAALLFLPVYRSFPLRVHPLSLLVGVVGIVVWVGLCRLDLETALFRLLGWESMLAAGARPSFDPLTAFQDAPFQLATFLAVRFFGLVCVVAFVEEWFLRGFVMRFFEQLDWWTIPIGAYSPRMFALGALYGVVSHPSEAIAAAVWFSMVSWLVWKTRSIWDGIVAHMVTNLLLGVYILIWRDWSLW